MEILEILKNSENWKNWENFENLKFPKILEALKIIKIAKKTLRSQEHPLTMAMPQRDWQKSLSLNVVRFLMIERRQTSQEKHTP